nr:MAG TPA: hypothetical protein [Caudoviricetes sp.]
MKALIYKESKNKTIQLYMYRMYMRICIIYFNSLNFNTLNCYTIL